LDKDVQDKMSKILTTEQQEQWNKSRPQGPPPGRRGDRNGPPANGPRGSDNPRGNESARDDGPRRGPEGRRRPAGDGSDNADGPPRGGPGGLDRLVGELRLKDDQKDKVQEILKAHHAKMDQVMAEQRTDLLKSMKSVLTDEQLEKLEKALPEPGKAGPPRGPEDRDAPPRGRKAPPEE
jgi:Spy/CpxP family protein refolding chaperone